MAPPLDPAAPSAPQLKRALGPVSLTLYGVGNMLGAGIYGLIGAAAGELGNAMWMAFLASMVAAAFTGLSYASLGSRYPRAGGAAYITGRAFGFPALAYVIGLAVMASGLTSMAAASNVFASYLVKFIGDVPLQVIAAAFVILMAAINFRGIRESAALNAVCTLVEAGGLLLVIVVGFRFIGSVNYLDMTSVKNPAGGFSALLILNGAVLTFYSFIGFEDLLNVSEEVENPQRVLPRALVGALLITTVVYMLISFIAVAVVSPAELAAAKAPGPPALQLVATTAAPWLPPLFFAGIALFAVTNTALLNFIMSSRLMYGMSTQGLLPAVLGKLHPTRQTPHRAILVLLVIVMALAMANIEPLARATSLLLLTSFIVVNAALIVLKRRPGEEKGGFEVPVFVPVCGILVCASLIVVSVWKGIASIADGGNDWIPLAIAGGLIAVIITLYATLRPRQPVMEG